jgi:hypothetical protein
MNKRELAEALKIAEEFTALPDPFNQLKRVKKLAKAFTTIVEAKEHPERRGDIIDMRTLN